MEGLYNHRNSNPLVPMMKSLNSNVLPMNSSIENQLFIAGPRYHASKTSSNNLENMESSLIKYLRSSTPESTGTTPSAADGFTSPVNDHGKYRPIMIHAFHGGSNNFGSRGPLTAVENLETPPARSPPILGTPVKVEEDVLVMDGILVGSLGGGRMRSSASSDSGGSSAAGNSLYKTEICRSWEDTDSCRYGSKCQFAHGKEELRPTRLHNKSKFEAQACKTYAITGSSTNSSKHRSVHPVAAVAALAPQPGAAMTVVQNTSIITAKNSNWSPQDDGIEVSLPSSSGKHTSREEIDFYIHGLLFGPPPRKRLPCFTQLCPENPALFPS